MDRGWLGRGGLALGSALATAAAMAAAPGPAATAPAQSAEVAPWDGKPQQSFTLDSHALHETRRLNVYLPPHYAADASARFPLLLMPDGGEAEDFPHVAVAVDAAIRAGRMRPVVLVGIENTERRRDMTGPTEVASDRRIAPHVGGSAAFRAFIGDELLPQLRQRYRLTDEAGIVGESLAGLFVLETLLDRPALFRHYIALSPSLWWNGGHLVHSAGARLAQAQPQTVDLYLATTGDDGVAELAGTLRDAMKAAPAGWHATIQAHPELRHDNIYRSLEAEVIPAAFAPR